MHVHPIHLQPFGLIQVVYLSLGWSLAPATPANEQGKIKCKENETTRAAAHLLPITAGRGYSDES